MLRFVIFTVLGTLLSGQHVPSTTYDSGRKVKLKGTVTRIDWVNPHAFFFVNVTDSAGTIANWALEVGTPFDLEKDGWKPNLGI